MAPQEIIAEINEVKKRILRVTQIAEDHRNELFFELGCNWAERHCKIDSIALLLQKKPEFWAFWSLQFKKQEESFLKRVEQRESCCYVKVTIGKIKEIEAVAYFKGDQLRQNYTKTMTEMLCTVRGAEIIQTLINIL